MLNKITTPIIVLFGATGAGKTTWKRYFVEQHKYYNIVSYTTRQKRENESEFDYYFISKERWHSLKIANKVINDNAYNGNFYGIRFDSFIEPKKSVMISDIDSIKRLYSIAKDFNREIISVYCDADIEELKRRHIARGTPERISLMLQEKKVLDEQAKKVLDFIVVTKEDADNINKYIENKYGVL